jgi:hypothetical protein
MKLLLSVTGILAIALNPALAQADSGLATLTYTFTERGSNNPVRPSGIPSGAVVDYIYFGAIITHDHVRLDSLSLQHELPDGSLSFPITLYGTNPDGSKWWTTSEFPNTQFRDELVTTNWWGWANGVPDADSYTLTVTIYIHWHTPTVTVSSVSPNLGIYGTLVTIRGTGFTPNATVTFGGAAGYGFHFVDDTTIRVLAGDHVPGTVTVTVTVGGASGSLPNSFTYQTPPTITAIAPNTGRISGGTSVTISGTNFIPGRTSVYFGSAQATSVTVLDTGTVTVVTPPHVSGPVLVSVVVAYLGADAFNGFTYLDPPTIAAVSPSGGLNTGGTWVTITGANFGQGAAVTFGGVAASQVTLVNATTLQASTPAHLTGPVDVSVTVDSQTGSASNAFRYYSVAQIMSVINNLLQ